MALSPAEIKAILDALEASDWDSATVTVDGVSISVARNGATPLGPTGTAGPATPAQPESVPPPPLEGHVITAPSVGVFWCAPRPGAPPFVEVGQRVEAGDTVCIVEMMKLMNNVVTDVAGVVAAVHAKNSASVEYGTPLISITPAR